MITTWIIFAVGLGILSWGADLFVNGASRLALKMQIPALLVGMTIVAFGSSAPELFVSFQALSIGQPEIVVTNILGSNLCNIGMALGLYALLRPFKMKGRFRDREFVFFVVSALIFWLFLRDDELLSRLEGGTLCLGLVLFVFLCVRAGQRAQREDKFIAEDLIDLDAEALRGNTSWNGGLLRLTAGFIGLHFGSELLINSAVDIGNFFALSPEIIGLFLVALGTSLPEIAISVLAAVRGEQSIALGNILGSNIFNIFCIGGLTALWTPLPALGDVTALDAPMMILFTLGFLAFLRVGRRLNRWEGLMLVLGYSAYVFFRLAPMAPSMA